MLCCIDGQHADVSLRLADRKRNSHIVGETSATLRGRPSTIPSVLRALVSSPRRLLLLGLAKATARTTGRKQPPALHSHQRSFASRGKRGLTLMQSRQTGFVTLLPILLAMTWWVSQTVAHLTGPAGATLPRVPAHRAFSFGWLTAYPDTRLVK